jgi:hypothetical protein
MTTIRFPNSVGIRSNGGRAENSFHEAKRPKLIGNACRNADVVDISTEAKRRYEKDNLVKLEKIRLHKDAAEYLKVLDKTLGIREPDPRNVYRPAKIAEVKDKLASGFYERSEDVILRKILEKYWI